ncbi:MAG TPA: hypothetical protein VFC38_05650 [Stellaceae bacterium]|nr:hypothetical protein [Stellaceae bacterium]
MAERPGVFDPLPASAPAPDAAPAGGWVSIVPVPDDAPAPPLNHTKLGAPVLVHEYRDALGRLIGFVRRFKKADGAKEFLPLTFCRHTESRAQEWRVKSWPSPRPLYGLDRLTARPGAPVLICEGEKAADAAGRLLPEYVAVTSPNGSKAGAKADWSPLRRRDVVIWPDSDAAGAAYAEAVARCLAAIGIKPRIIDPPPAVTEGWDAADAEGDGYTAERARSLLAGAHLAAASKDDGGGGSKKRPGRDGLLALLGDDVELWHDPKREAYASFLVDRGIWANARVDDREFRLWLAGRYYASQGSAVSGQVFDDALRVIEARAVHDGAEFMALRRVGEKNQKLYIDLGGPTWNAVEIDLSGWRVIDRPPVKFLRSPGQQALPTPEPGGEIEELQSFVNLESEADFKLLVSYIVAALRPRGPFPVLGITGEQGSSKSTLSRLVRQLIDPNEAPLRTVPRDERDFLIMASNNWVIGLDNITKLHAWASDALCRLSTGSGFSTRELHTDRSEVIFQATRPILLNGIGDVTGRPDLQERSIFLSLPAIPQGKRRSEAEFWSAFDVAAPRIFGALLDAVSAALRNLPTTRIERLPRMADFAVWIEAAAPGLGWEPGEFLTLYEANRTGTVLLTLESSMVGLTLRNLILGLTDPEKGWEGTASTLLLQLEQAASETFKRARAWPRQPGALGMELRRLAPVLRQVGIEIEHKRDGKNRDRVMRIYRATP